MFSILTLGPIFNRGWCETSLEVGVFVRVCVCVCVCVCVGVGVWEVIALNGGVCYTDARCLRSCVY